MKQTAVEWLVEHFDLEMQDDFYLDKINQAKEMEKEQMNNFFKKVLLKKIGRHLKHIGKKTLNQNKMSAKQEKIQKSFREKIETIRMDIVNGIEDLHLHIVEYKDTEDFEKAMKCDIKRRQLIMVLGRLDEALK